MKYNKSLLTFLTTIFSKQIIAYHGRERNKSYYDTFETFPSVCIYLRRVTGRSLSDPSCCCKNKNCK